MDFIQIWLSLALFQAGFAFPKFEQSPVEAPPIIVDEDSYPEAFTRPNIIRINKKDSRITDIEEYLNTIKNPDLDHTIIPMEFVADQGWSVSAQSDTIGPPLDPYDFENGTNVPADPPVDDPTMMAGLFQGDIIIPNNNLLFNLTAHTAKINGSLPMTPRRDQQNAIINLEKRWVNGKVPYSISNQYSSSERATIAKGMGAFHKETCIRFVPRSSEQDYIHIAKDNGCSSAVGRVGGRQTVSLGNGCIYYGIVVHELMHAAGFWHEQSRADRDDHIRIMWNNIQAGMDYNFQKYDWTIIQHLGVSYDTGSIMHYGAKSFAKDRSKPTIIPRNGERIGQRDNFSRLDIKKLNELYKCNGGGTGGGSGGGIIVPPTTQKPTDKCTNSAQHCDYWKGIGECAKNPSWMNENCKKACDQCGKCQDNSKYCSAWRDRGECLKSATYMHKMCRKSCGLCHGETKPQPTCDDENQYCTAWANSGECRINPDYMFQHCKKSCHKCSRT